MSILSEWNSRKAHATMCLILLYRELREVFESDLLLDEKEYLFTKTHVDKIRDIAWLVRPDLYLLREHQLEHPTSNLRHDRAGRQLDYTKEMPGRLLSYLDELATALDYSHLKMELVDAMDEVAAVMALDLPITKEGDWQGCRERKKRLAPLVPRLLAAFKALRLEPYIEIGSPLGDYFLTPGCHQQWFESLTAAMAKV